MARRPFSAQIVRITNNRIFINAGAMLLIAPGNKLVVYKAEEEWLHARTDEAAMAETPIASGSVVPVQPLFFIGELSVDPNSIKLRTGDMVRFSASD